MSRSSALVAPSIRCRVVAGTAGSPVAALTLGAGLTIVRLVVFPTAAAAQANVDQQLRTNRERLEEIRQERDALRDELEALRGRAHDISGELSNIERQKSVTTRMVNELDRQMGLMRGQLDTLSLSLTLAQDNLAEKRAVLERRLRDISKRGNLWSFEVLLAAESFGDLVSRYKYLYLVSQQDQSLVGEVQELRDRIARQRRQAVNVREELVHQRDERHTELERYTQLERERERNLRRTRASEREAAERLDSLAEDERRLNEVVAALERARRSAVATTPRGAPTGEGSIHTRDLGSLDWPVEGAVLYQFGRARRPNNTFTRNNGIGIGVPVGTPVRTIENGTVRLAEQLGTYGPSVAVDHGGGFYTLYLYLSQVEVSVGQAVARGTIVGLSGGANSDEGPHIEFQIRGEGGIALDPVNWLRNRTGGAAVGR